MQTPRVFSVIGGTLWGNRGAEAMVVTTVGMLRNRWPGSRFHVFSYFPAEDTRLLAHDGIDIQDGTPWSLVTRMLPGSVLCYLAGILGLRPPDYWLPREIVALRDSTALLDVSGISFADGRVKFLPFNVLCVLPALLIGVPVVKLSQAVGPFQGMLTRFAGKTILSRCQRVFARGKRSADYMAQLGIDGSIRSDAADIAFLFEERFSLTDEGTRDVDALLAATAADRRSGGPLVGLCPSSVVLQKAARSGVDYIGLVSSVVSRLVQRGYLVVVLPNATRAGSRSHRNNDIPVIKAIRDRCRQTLANEQLTRIHWLDVDVNSAGLRRLIASLDVLVTSRFHAMIAALASRVPAVVIGWSHKYREVLEEFGLQDFCFGFELQDTDAVVASVATLSAPAFQAEWRSSVHFDVTRQAAERQFNDVVRDFG